MSADIMVLGFVCVTLALGLTGTLLMVAVTRRELRELAAEHRFHVVRIDALFDELTRIDHTLVDIEETSRKRGRGNGAPDSEGRYI